MSGNPRQPLGAEWRKPPFLSPKQETDDVYVIAVMGVTGSGKSHFLRLVTGDDGIGGPAVGHGLESCTQKTEKYESILGGRQFIWLDSPGFDDSYRGDADVLADIASVLASSYRSNLKLNGIIYLHRIKDERMTNAILRNLTMFRNLCGDDAFRNVILVTTFWDELPDPAKGEMREKQLKKRNDWWGYMTSKGSKIERSYNTRGNALRIVSKLLDLPAITLQVQREMVYEGLEVDNTTAGKVLNRELREQQRLFEENIKQLRREKDQAERDHDVKLQDFLMTMEAEKRALLQDIESEQAALHADRREEMRRMEQEFADERVRLLKKMDQLVCDSNRMKEDIELEAMDQRIRLTSDFDEKLYALSQQATQERRRTEELKTRLNVEEQQSSSRFQEVLEQMNVMIIGLKQDKDHAQSQEREQMEKRIRKMERSQEEIREQGASWMREMERVSQEIREHRVAQQQSGGDEWERHEKRIQELEARKKDKTNGLWTSIGSLAGVGSLLVALL